MNSVILIGMPGAGKSTAGVILAKAANLSFCDTDLLIQEAENMLLQDIIDQKGEEYFLQMEEEYILRHEYRRMAVATGGSAVYGAKAMAHLKSFGKAVFLDVPVCELKIRVGNFAARGVIGRGALEEIYNDRIALYRKYADVTVHCDGKNVEQIVAEILNIV